MTVAACNAKPGLAGEGMSLSEAELRYSGAEKTVGESTSGSNVERFLRSEITLTWAMPDYQRSRWSALLMRP
jgi:hypothetical protein